MPASAQMGPNAQVIVSDDGETLSIQIDPDRPGESAQDIAWESPECPSKEHFIQLASVFATFHKIKLVVNR